MTGTITRLNTRVTNKTIRNLLYSNFAVLLITGATAFAEPERLTEWEFVCAYQQVDCSNVPEPIIVQIEMFGYYGFFRPDWDARFVFINVNENQVQKNVTAVHEMSHYLDYHSGKLAFDPNIGYDLEALCQSEGTAFNVSNAWVEYNNYPDEYSTYDWIRWYRHCQA